MDQRFADYTLEQWRELRDQIAAAVDPNTVCENRVQLQQFDHRIPDLDRCQIVLGGPSVTAPSPWVHVPAANAHVLRCSHCREDGARPNAWLREVPLERFAGYILGLAASARGHCFAIDPEGLR